MKQVILTRAVGMPIASAAGRKPPVERTQLPKLVRASRRPTTMAIPPNQRKDARKSSPGPT